MNNFGQTKILKDAFARYPTADTDIKKKKEKSQLSIPCQLHIGTLLYELDLSTEI